MGKTILIVDDEKDLVTTVAYALEQEGWHTQAAHDGRPALELANQQLSRQYNQDFSQLVGKYALAGSPEDCRERLDQYLAAGARTVILAHGCPPDYVADNRVAIAEGIAAAYR